MTRLPRYQMLIGGELTNAADGTTMPSINPATEEVIAELPAAAEADIEQAYQAAAAAQPAWRDARWQERARVVRAMADIVREHAAELGVLDARDGGNPAEAMRLDAIAAGHSADYFAGAVSELKGETFESGADGQAYTVREPFGVIGRIIPFNHPIRFAVSKIAAPLVAGNAVILKPAEQTSLSALRFGELVRDIVPAGVLNVVSGRGAEAGKAIVDHPGIPRVAFTGGVATGKEVLRAAADGMKNVSLELGGKNPLLVFDDVDVDAVVAASIKGMNFSRCQGQSCQSTSRVFVHRRIADEFIAKLCSGVEALTVGDPLEPTTDMGPLAFERHYQTVNDYIESGLAEGARLMTGGGRPDGKNKGYFVSPTVFAEVSPDMRIAREEIFGPVMSIFVWDSLDETLEVVNGTSYALTANIWTNDFRKAMRAARAVDAGYLWINGNSRRQLGAPFGGFKNSGIGKEAGIEEIRSYTRGRTVELYF